MNVYYMTLQEFIYSFTVCDISIHEDRQTDNNNKNNNKKHNVTATTAIRIYMDAPPSLCPFELARLLSKEP